jgi:hypothetical protein
MRPGVETWDGQAVTPKHVKWFPGVLEPTFCDELSDSVLRLAEKALHGTGPVTKEELNEVMKAGGEWLGKTSFLPYGALNCLKIGNLKSADAIEDKVRSAVLSRLGQGSQFESTPYTGCFLLFPGKEFKWHTDAQYDGFLRDGITVWITLNDCGEDRPSLSCVDASDEAVRKYMLAAAKAHGVNIEPGGDIRQAFESQLKAQMVPTVYADCMKLANLRNHFGHSNILNVKARAGDCMVMSNWTLHATYIPPVMRYPYRITAVYRYFVNAHQVTDARQPTDKRFEPSPPTMVENSATVTALDQRRERAYPYGGSTIRA